MEAWRREGYAGHHSRALRRRHAGCLLHGQVPQLESDDVVRLSQASGTAHIDYLFPA